MCPAFRWPVRIASQSPPDRLRALMRPGHKGALALAFVLVLVGAAGCGYSPGNEGDEGVPIELGNLEINVQLTRFLNPSDHEDKAYLVGQAVPAPPGKAYLGVFLTIKNHADRE